MIQLANGSEKLTFDVLGCIFRYYAVLETSEYPLETLLQVCQAWREAAMGHRSLWGHINISLSQEYSFCYNKRRIISRLDRSGSFAPLDIEIRIESGMSISICKRCGLGCTSSPRKCRTGSLFEILDLLAGLDGTHCQRWRSLYLHPNWWPYYLEEEEQPTWLRSLTYPMPSLEFLHLVVFAANIAVFPSCPRLKTVILMDTHLGSPIDIKNAQTIRYHSVKNFIGYDSPTDLSAADKLQTLDVNIQYEGRKLILPPSLPYLSRMSVGNYLPLGFLRPTIPNLSYLDISRINWTQVETFVGHRIASFPELRVIKLNWKPEDRLLLLRDNLKKVLGLISDDIHIYASLFILMILLKLKWEMVSSDVIHGNDSVDGVRLLRGDITITVEDVDKTFYLPKQATKEMLMSIANESRIPTPYISWDDLYRAWRELGESNKKEQVSHQARR